MNNIFLISLIAITQRVPPPPPAEAKIGIPPPVGDVPLDGSIWVLIGFALIIGACAVYHKRTKAL